MPAIMIGRINANIFALLTHSAQFDVSGLNRVEYLISTHMAKLRFCHMLQIAPAFEACRTFRMGIVNAHPAPLFIK
ncbi:hypothetical protein Brsp05_04644 [Brucella sp. NBRC 12953]